MLGQQRQAPAPLLQLGDRQHELLSALLDVAGLLIVMLDAAGRIVLFNRSCEQLTGWSMEEAAGQAVWDLLLVPEEREAVQAHFQDLAAGRFPSEYENYWQTRQGRRHWIHWKNTALTDAAGAVQYVIATGLDISERKHIEQALQAAHQYNQAILETAVDGIVCIDEAGRITVFNRAAEKLFGYPAAEVLGESINLLMEGEDGDGRHDAYLRRYAQGGPARILGIGREVRGRRRDGSVFPMELSVGEVPLQGKRMFTGIVRDISERKQAEQEAKRRLDELAQVSRLSLMGEMASGLAHEINQPLAAIVSYAQACRRLLQAGRSDPQVLLDALTQIARQGQRAGEIVNHLRQFIDRGRTERTVADINAVIREVVTLLSHEIQVHRVTVALGLDEGLPALTVDKIQIEQVILNLVKNAIDAMQAVAGPRHLHVASRHHPSQRQVQVRVSDSGAGLPPGLAERVFDPLFTTKPNGIGVGLSISRSIVRAHGGCLWAEPNDGAGASFTFTLPVNDHDAPDE